MAAKKSEDATRVDLEEQLRATGAVTGAICTELSRLHAIEERVRGEFDRVLALVKGLEALRGRSGMWEDPNAKRWLAEQQRQANRIAGWLRIEQPFKEAVQ